MPLPAEADVEPLVPQAGASKAGTNADRVQQVDGALLENTCPHAVNHVLASAVLDNDGIDAIQMKQMPK
jgi:hypothetical protein